MFNYKQIVTISVAFKCESMSIITESEPNKKV